jgi:hypothetical protein
METVLLLTSIAVLFDLTRSTEIVLNIRQHRRDQGHDTKTYL